MLRPVKEVYVVQGSTGEYSDHCEWLVKAFIDEDKAKKFVSACDEIYREQVVSRSSFYDRDREWKHPLDPFFKEDYTGVHYTYFSVELEE